MSSATNTKVRGRPVEVSLGDVVKTIGLTAKSPSSVASELNISRATLHRKMKSIIDQGLVVVEGRGRAVTYRLPTPLEQIESARSSLWTLPATKGERRYRLVLDQKAARRLVDDLDLACRVGIGQFEPIAESIRYRTFSQDPIASEVALDRLTLMLQSVKADLFGYSAHASHGIFSPHVHDSFRLGWAVMKAVRHRLAWDQNPAGSIGVHHDEPISGLDFPSGVIAYSCTPPGDGSATVVVVEAGEAAWTTIFSHLEIAKELQDGRFEVLTSLAKQGFFMRHDGEKVSAAHVAMADLLVEGLQQIWSEQAASWGPQRTAQELSRSSAQALVIQNMRDALSGVGGQFPMESAHGLVQAAPMSDDEPMFGLQVSDLPDGFFVHRQGEMYRVIGPSDSADHLRIYAESASLQTAMLKAQNAIKGAPSRALGF